jgi:hypothetical protein
MGVEREMLGEIMTAHDVDADAVEIDGVTHRRVRAPSRRMSQLPGRSPSSVGSTATATTMRHVASVRWRSVGVVGGFWTEQAAKTALCVVAQMTPQKAEELFQRTGGMTPSKSSLDRLPKLVADRWEARREQHEAALRDALVIPHGTTSVAVSRDRVLAPLDGGKALVEVRNTAARDSRTSQGPAGYREVGCDVIVLRRQG